MTTTAKLLVALGALASATGSGAVTAQSGTATSVVSAGASVTAIVGGIINYTRWPQQQRDLRLCIAGNARFASQVGQAKGQPGQNVTTSRLSAAASPAGCDVLYLGQMADPARRKLLLLARNRAILTIAENDPACRSGAMICLLSDESPVTFRLNLDAVARSGVRVDPRVLRISGDGS